MLTGDSLLHWLVDLAGIVALAAFFGFLFDRHVLAPFFRTRAGSVVESVLVGALAVIIFGPVFLLVAPLAAVGWFLDGMTRLVNGQPWRERRLRAGQRVRVQLNGPIYEVVAVDQQFAYLRDGAHVIAVAPDSVTYPPDARSGDVPNPA